MSSQKISHLIQNLSQDLSRPSETRGWTGRFWISWILCFVLVGMATWYTTYRWPYRAYLPTDLTQPMFWVESVFWILASIAAAICAYQSSFPIWPKYQTKIFTGGLIAALILYTLTKGGDGSFSSELGLERGGCGIFIFLFGAISAGWMVTVIRKAAPTRLAEAGAWSAASAGCIGATFMHLVCPHENFVHLLLWHFSPVILLVAIGAGTARKVLSW
jgi:hypothetical protein